MIDPRASTLVVLLALGGVALYPLGLIGETVAAVASALCVLIIAASLYLIFSADSESDGEGTHGEVEA